MKATFLPVAVFLATPLVAQELVVNGSFEATTAVGCSFDLDNATFTAAMANATAFGTADELDVIDTSVCKEFVYDIPAADGAFKVAVRQPSFKVGQVDAFSLDLASPAIAGQNYTLTFHGALAVYLPAGPIEVGLSTSPTSFGTLVATGTPTSPYTWSKFVVGFTAPITAPYLTLRQSNTYDTYSYVDAISLVPTTCGPAVRAAQLTRAGAPPNPIAFLPGVGVPPVLGGSWDPIVDHATFFPGAVVDFLALTGAPTNAPTAFGTLLVDLSGPTFLQPAAAGTPFSVPIPLDCALVGQALFAQVASSDGVATRLTNGLDLIVGSY